MSESDPTTQLQIEESGKTFRLVIPYRLRQKIWMAVAFTVMLCFGFSMTAIAEYCLQKVTTNRLLWLLPMLVAGGVILMYFFSLSLIWASPDTVIEYDGKALSLGSVGSEIRRTWPRDAVKSLHVSRLPMVPVANVVIQIGKEPPVRAGTYSERELTPAVRRLCVVMGLYRQSVSSVPLQGIR